MLQIIFLLLVDLAVPVYIIWGDLNGHFESVGAFALIHLIIIGIVIHTVTMLIVRRRICVYLTQTKLWRGASANAFIIPAILLWTFFLIVLPSYAVKSIAPSYDAYVKNTAIEDLKQLEALYMEPSYLPPQVKFTNKGIEEESWSMGGYVRLKTTYVCLELNISTFGNVSVSVSPLTSKYNLRNPETVKVLGKKAVFVGDSHLVLYDGNIVREVFRSGECGVTKDDLVKIMSSLQPAKYVAGTQYNHGPAYHSLDAK